MPGHIYEPNSQASGLLPSKALSGPRVPEIDTIETDPAASLAFRAVSYYLVWSRCYHLRRPMSSTNAMGLLRRWLLQPSLLPNAVLKNLC